MEIKQSEIIEFMRSNGIKPSYQRIKIYEYLVKNRNHPTTEIIYHNLIKKIPTFSRTTVYNTMELFIKKGIVSMISIDEKEARFDADTSIHAHFMCTVCKNIYDIPVKSGEVNISGLKGFKVSENHINFKGICKSCSKHNKSEIN